MLDNHNRSTPPWGLLLPMLVVMTAVSAWPLVQTLWLSVTNSGMPGADVTGEFVGLQNYANLLQDAEFWQVLGRTCYFSIVSVALQVVVGVPVAILLNQEFKGRALARALLVLPWALPTIVNAMMWRLIANPQYGSLNAALTQLGLLEEYRSWLGDPDVAMNMIILADSWKNFPIIAIFALAALQGVSKDLYEASKLDGAPVLSRFWHITLPGIAPALSAAIVLRFIDAFKVFDVIYVMTKGGPADSTKTLSLYVYQQSFSNLSAGQGAASAIAVAVCSVIGIAVYFRLIKRKAP